METYETIATVISVILVIVSIKYGFKARDLTKRITRVISFLNAAQNALADGKLTAAEISNLVEKAKRIIS